MPPTLTPVFKLLPPTVSWLAPRKNPPKPSIEPAVILWSLPGPAVPVKSNEFPDARSSAWRGVLLPEKTAPPMMVALPPLLIPEKTTADPLAPLLIVALPAVLVSLKKRRAELPAEI